jgi:formylglycine-generating enzyme required for sulfatase activity
MAVAGSGCIDLGSGVKLELVAIPSGKFLMGSPNDEKGRVDDEGPQHWVTISNPFYIGKYAVTQEQYVAVMDTNPSCFTGTKNPVEVVSWNDAAAFCRMLSRRTGKTIRLPTEAEWEYACRAGTTTRFYAGDSDTVLDSISWFEGNSRGTTHPVGGKAANAFGLYDMHGNVAEWCQDFYDANYYAISPNVDPTGPTSGSGRVARGGSWLGGANNCRSSRRRNGVNQGNRANIIGFRVASALPRP